MSSNSPAGTHQRPVCSVQVILLTYEDRVLADDTFHAAASLAARQPGLQVVVAWGGQPGPRQTRWEADIAHWQALGADVRWVADPSPLARVQQSLQQKKDWVLPLADDDPIAVNYLRALVDGTIEASGDTACVLASNHVQNTDNGSHATRIAGWTQPDAQARLLDMLVRPGLQGTLFWGAYRHHVFAEWLDFAMSLPYQPSYLDQFLPHLAACHGRLGVAREETVLLKDERHWQDDQASARTNARYCPQADMSLYHEWFWLADLWSLLAGRTQGLKVPLALKHWGRQMLGHMLDRFKHRRQWLGLTLAPEHAQLLEVLRPACQWLFAEDKLEDLIEGMTELSQLAIDIRAEWVAAGHPPAIQVDRPAAGTHAPSMETA